MQDQEPISNKDEPTSDPVKSTETKRNGSGVIIIATIAMMIAITSLVFQFFFWQLHKKTENRLVARGHEFQARLDASLGQLLDRFNQQQKTIETLVAATGEQAKQKTIFLAEEAKHLVNTAQFTMVFDRNYDLALRELTAADQKLQETNDPSLNPIRQEINNAVVSLNAIPKIDLSGLAMRINAISNQVSSLSALPVISHQNKVITSQSKTTNWKEKFWATLESLRGIISIRRLSESVKPLVSPEQQVYLVENIRLQLSQAQWALLHQEPDLYQQALSSAKNDLQKYYSMNPTGANLINMIVQLQQVNIKPAVPDVSNIITLLQRYIDTTSQTMIQTSKPIEPSLPTQAIQPAPPAATAPAQSPNVIPKTTPTPPVTIQPSTPTSSANTPQPRALPS